MSLPQPRSGSDWTVETLRQLMILQAEQAAALRRSDEKYHEERDRRYTEVKNAEEKALKIKETADHDALHLARDIQTNKDEKANELRSQIERERGTYATQSDLRALSDRITAELRPIADYIALEQGRSGGHSDSMRNLVTIVGLVLTAITVMVGVWVAFHH